jgi:hypothetical protein
MVVVIRPGRGGFIRAFGLGWFIREYLLGHGPEGSPNIDPEKGAPQADVFFHYKLALFRTYGEDSIAYENEARIKVGKPIYTPEEYEERLAWHMARTPYKLTSCRYHSFVNYCGMLRRLGWLEEVSEEPSGPQEYDPKFQPRRYYRLTRKGIEAPDPEWSNPKLVLYPQFSLEYHQQKRKEHHYSRKAPTKSHRAVRV